MKKIKISVGLLLIALLTSCSSISSGTITDKNHRSGYYYTTFICAGYNAQGVCMTQVPIQNWQPPSWSFDLKHGEETGWAYISEGTYNQYEIGDFYQSPDEK